MDRELDSTDATTEDNTEQIRFTFNNLSLLFKKMSDVEKRYYFKLVCKVISRLSGYCNQLPILGYNSGKYDLNLIRKEILLQNGFTETQNSFIIKKNNGYLCISTPLYKFLDAANYLSVGTSYDAFLKSYDTEQNKSFFPYEWLDDIKKLEQSYLPEYSAFYSNLTLYSPVCEISHSVFDHVQYSPVIRYW